MTTSQPIDAGELCGWIARRIDNTIPVDHTNQVVHAYGAGANGRACRREAHHNRARARRADQRWFRVEVTEFAPNRLHPGRSTTSSSPHCTIAPASARLPGSNPSSKGVSPSGMTESVSAPQAHR